MDKTGAFLLPRMRRVEQIHFVGIGGAGMCGIAEVLNNEGYRITGSDLAENRATQNLRALGVKIFIGHDEKYIQGADVVVKSTAVGASNPEIIAAQRRLIPVIPRALMLAELMRFRYGIAIAGTHGKTTTTSLVSGLLTAGGLDPSFVIGGKLNCGGNAQLGKSAYFVAEADESDASFLYLKPMMAVVTNIDADHMDTYGGDFSALRTTFLEFLHHLPFYGLAVLCLEDETIKSLLPEVQRPTLTYGFDELAQYRAQDWQQEGLLSRFTALRPSPHRPLKIQFHCPGRHNVLNALAAITIATELGVADEAIIRGLEEFQGVGRRFQMLGEKHFSQGSALFIDDYGHHPREITATIEAVRQVWPDKRLIHVFQPHRYSRTQALFYDFIQALSLADELLLMDIYPAGEVPLPEVSSQRLLEAIQRNHPHARMVDEKTIAEHLDDLITQDNIVLMQGAGSIGQLALNLTKAS